MPDPQSNRRRESWGKVENCIFHPTPADKQSIVHMQTIDRSVKRKYTVINREMYFWGGVLNSN